MTRRSSARMIGSMFGLGVPEVIFILLIALLLFGPKKLPEVGRVIGKGLGEFRRASTELQRAINTELDPQEPAPPRSRLRSAEEEPERDTAEVVVRPASDGQARGASSSGSSTAGPAARSDSAIE